MSLSRTKKRHPQNFAPRYTERDMQHDQGMANLANSRSQSVEAHQQARLGIAVQIVTQVNPLNPGWKDVQEDAMKFLRASFQQGTRQYEAMPLHADPEDDEGDDDEDPSLGGGEES